MPDLQSELEKELQQQGLLQTQTQLGARQQAEAEGERAPRLQDDFQIENNPFFQLIVKNRELTAAQKRDEVQKMMTFKLAGPNEDPATVEEANQTRLQQFELFKQWLMSERRRMAQDIIDVTDQKSFASLASMYNDINQAMLDYRERLRPLKETVDAIQTLLGSGDQELILKVYKSFGEDDLAKAKWEKAVRDIEADVRRDTDTIKRNKLRLAALQQDTNIFGKLKKSARTEISQLEPATKELEAKVQGYTTEDGKTVSGTAKAYIDLKNNPPKEQYPEYAQAKQRIRELRDLSGPEWEKRVSDLIADAQNFINTTDVRGKEVLEHHTLARQHIDILDKANEGMQKIYALLGDATKKASEDNQATYQNLKTAPENEEYLAKVKRESQLKAVNLFIDESNSTAQDTIKVGGELDAQAVMLTTFRSDNIQKKREAQDLIGSTNARTAEGIATALFSVTNAAIEQARVIADNTNAIMQGDNDQTIRKEVERLSLSSNSFAQTVKAADARLKTIMQTTEQAAKNADTGYAQAKAAIAAYEKTGAELRRSLQNLQGASAKADVQSGTTSTFNDAAAQVPANDPAPAPAPAPATDSRKEKFKSDLTNVNL